MAMDNEVLGNVAFGIIFLIIAGLLVGLQGPLNGKLSHYSSGSFSSMINFAIGFWPLFIYFMGDSRGGKLINGEEADWSGLSKKTLWWAWLGGIFGSFFVLILTIIIPRRGAAITIGVIVCAQLIASIVFDNCGWLGSTAKPTTAVRGVGAAVMVIGIVLVTLF
ncbi:hypothetical protein H4219_001058 [Mycoemilia scoparia]|uniref:DMT family transporter n=1 Tax=Mycoemilia scoparia TaxID=417184 RepID=A0A9W8DW81_9FUNG|nr:hypothetical protein H4219_001058 [Mycoemilia scoparia]